MRRPQAAAGSAAERLRVHRHTARLQDCGNAAVSVRESATGRGPTLMQSKLAVETPRAHHPTDAGNDGHKPGSRPQAKRVYGPLHHDFVSLLKR